MQTTMPDTSSIPQLPLDLGQAPAPMPEALDWRAQVPSVSQLTRRIRGHIENSFFDVWVRGEISNFRKPVSGHAYFVVKDAGAQLRTVMFKGSMTKVKFQPKDGMEVLVHGKVTVYEARGEYQMVCDAMEPVGVGALQLAFEQLKQKLQGEGLFEQKFKKPLPHLPRRIAMVTSATGAAVRDVLKVLSRRCPNLKILIIPASVQGEKAAPEIVAGIALAQRWNEHHPDDQIEAMIVGRGGGSLEDMWCFNEEIVARAIFACKIPLISAVGHEIDFTIADFVADLRAPTPSAAAEIIVPNLQDLIFKLDSHTNRLRMLTLKRLEQTRLHLGHLSQRLIDPRQRIREIRERFVQMTQKLETAIKTRVLLTRRRTESTVGLLHSLSPLQVIARGYSLTQLPDGTILKSAKAVTSGETIQTRLPDGIIESIVK